MDGYSQSLIDEQDARLSDLLDRVERGETVTVSRNGRPVAKLVGVQEPKDAAAAKAALAEILRFREQLREEGVPPVTHDEIRAMLHEGHRY